MLEIQNKTRAKLPRLPFVRIKDAILGPEYDLSLVFIGDKRSRDLNRKYRGKDKPTNILSFPYSETDGEILINLRLAKSEAPDFDRSETKFIGYLFIHGLLHLNGLAHGSTMEEKERTFCRKFSL